MRLGRKFTIARINMMSEGENKRVWDAVAWGLNVSTSVAIVFANKILMDPRTGLGFVFGVFSCFLIGLRVKHTDVFLSHSHHTMCFPFPRMCSQR